MPTVLATSEILVMNKSIAVEGLEALLQYQGSSHSFRTVGSAKSTIAETKAFKASIQLTVASGQPRASDAYCGRRTSIRAARL